MVKTRKASKGRLGKGQAGHFKFPPDTGCRAATKFLGEQSLCENCPFYPRECIEVIADNQRLERTKEIK